MPITCRQTVTVTDDDQISVRSLPISKDNDAVGRSVDLGVIDCRNIRPHMHFDLAVEWVCTVAVVTCDCAADRPNTWRVQKSSRSLLRDLFEHRKLIFHFGGSVF